MQRAALAHYNLQESWWDPMDGLAEFKQAQKESWRHFAPMEALTTPAAGILVRFAGVAKGMRVLDAGCGTGVVAITAARLGVRVRAIDLTPQLLERAKQNSQIAEVEVDWHEGDVEQLPFADGEFDIVLSQFAHIFAPRPEVAIGELLRVVRSGGTIAFSSWPPELLGGRLMAVQARYSPPPPAGVSPPVLWGDPEVVRKRLGGAVADITFARECLLSPALSPQHYRLDRERSSGPMMKLTEHLSATNPERLRAFRQEYDAIVTEYMRDNVVRQDYLLTRATKV